jgi:hypothetical protein
MLEARPAMIDDGDGAITRGMNSVTVVAAPPRHGGRSSAGSDSHQIGVLAFPIYSLSCFK